MVDELELGQATIVYEDPDDGVVEETVDNEEIVYARDHWMLRAGSDDQNNDLMKQIPRDRVLRVERNVQQFEDEAQTVKHRVESIADDLRRKLPVDVGMGPGGRGGGRGGRGSHGGRAESGRTETEPMRIPVDEPDDSEDGAGGSVSGSEHAGADERELGGEEGEPEEEDRTE